MRIMSAKALGESWKNLLKENTIRRSFERTGLSLKVDGSEDSELMKFQGQSKGIPEGLNLAG